MSARLPVRLVVGREPAAIFTNPVMTWAPHDVPGALHAIAASSEARKAGYWIGGALSYELGSALLGVPAHPPQTPLLLLAAFPPPQRSQRFDFAGLVRASAPLPRVGADAYAEAVTAILGRIRDGEVYQVNYTIPFDLAIEGASEALFAQLSAASRAPYAALLEWDGLTLISLSPELFLRFDGDRITTKPMKGTAPLNDLRALEFPKNRAEHLMIVDLLRNDLHRVCNDVRVEQLFEVERYPTFATMTSTIAGTLRSGVSAEELLRAVYPCGSITGAPKRAAMHEIHAREREARGFYTGSIGFLSPQRTGWWNVAIRTLQQFDRSATMRFDAGGGIVADSEPRTEREEITIKARVLDGTAHGFHLLETLRSDADPQTRDAHIARLTASAAAFGWIFDAAKLRELLAQHDTAPLAVVRIALSGSGRLALSRRPFEPIAGPVALCTVPVYVRSRDPFLRHKTSLRKTYDAALAAARARGCFDGIIFNERGEVTETSRFNLFVREGGTLLTPILASGVLPGILRSKLVSEGQAREAVVDLARLADADELFIGNSARGLIPATLQKVQVCP